MEAHDDYMCKLILGLCQTDDNQHSHDNKIMVAVVSMTVLIKWDIITQEPMILVEWTSKQMPSRVECLTLINILVQTWMISAKTTCIWLQHGNEMQMKYAVIPQLIQWKSWSKGGMMWTSIGTKGTHKLELKQVLKCSFSSRFRS